MATQFEINCALMAGAAYFSTRSEGNRFSVPQGWEQVSYSPPVSSGFEASAFGNGTTIANSTEIVISFAGTGPGLNPDWIANSDLAMGSPTDQLREAALYYCQIKAENPGATITFTGHSLGGGLAALLGVFFDEKAVTFDPAPFRQSVDFDEGGLAVYLDLLDYLRDHGVSETVLQPLVAYGNVDASGLFGTDRLDERKGNVTGLSVAGEVLSVSPATWLDRIGTQEPSLTHGGTDVSGTNLHSIALLTAFVENDQFREVTTKLTDLLGMIFDSNLYYNDPNKLIDPKRNFLENLIRHEVGVQGSFAADHMLDRFTADLKKIAQDGGLTMSNNDLTKALTAFAMQKYYEEPASGADYGQELFSAEGVTGGIRFDRSNVADTLDNAKGYTLYFTNYLTTLPAVDRTFIEAMLPNLLDWFIQAGAGGMTATAGDLRAFMLGGSGSDNLTGGSQADVLVGNGGADTLSGGDSYDVLIGGDGNDTLDGGTGSDILLGGTGMDTYIWHTGDGNDSIIEEQDADGKIHGIIRIINEAGQEYLAAGGFFQEGDSNIWHMTMADDTVLTLTHGSTWQLGLADGSTLDLGSDFQDGDFGIKLIEQAEDPQAYNFTGSDNRDSVFVTRLGDSENPRHYGLFLHWDEDGANTTTTVSFDENGFFSLHLTGGGGDDYLIGMTQSDYISGGDGNDWLAGDQTGEVPGEVVQGDIIRGDAGIDYISGSVAGDDLAGGTERDVIQGNDGEDCICGDDGNDLLAGGSHNDVLTGGAGNDFLMGDGYFTYDPVEFSNDHSVVSIDFTYSQSGYATGWSVNSPYVFNFLNDAVAAGDDTLIGGAGLDWLEGGAGDDLLSGEADADTLIGGDGDDFLSGGSGNDWLIGDNGDLSGNGNDILSGGDGNDLLYGLGGDDCLSGDAGDDTLAGFDGADYVSGDDGSDTLYGGGDDDMLLGGGGNDTLVGQEGNDILNGGAGNDDLWGDNGDNSGTGADTLYGGGGADRLQGAGGNDTLYGDEDNDILFGMTGADALHGGSGDDELQGGEGNDLLAGDDGADTLYGQDGNDLLDGGVGVDQLIGGVGDDVLSGGDDNDQLWGDNGDNTGSGNDTLYGEAGDDYLYGEGGDDILYGGDGNDFLMGGTGNDFLDGGEGDDTYYYSRGSGRVHLQDDSGFDRVIFQGGISLGMISLSLGSLMISSGTAGDELHLDGVDYDNLAATSPIDVIEFSDGQTMTMAEVIAAVGIDIPATEDADTLTGTSERDNINALAGDDMVDSRGGNDILDLGAGNDTAYAGIGDDTVHGGLGNDLVFGGADNDTLLGDDGDDITGNNSVLTNNKMDISLCSNKINLTKKSGSATTNNQFYIDMQVKDLADDYHWRQAA